MTTLTPDIVNATYSDSLIRACVSTEARTAKQDVKRVTVAAAEHQQTLPPLGKLTTHMDTTRDITNHNRLAWNAIALGRKPEPPDFFAAGGSTLDQAEADALGDVRGQSILHLQCANGNESLSLAASGASVVGVDISDVAIQMASDNAMATGLSARFVAADVYDIPDELREFDIVYASAGVVCWLPDLNEWASIISDRLRNGGRLVLYEHHPLWDTLNTTGGTLSVDRSYFGHVAESTSADCHDSRTPLGATPASEFISFVRPIGEVVTALLTAGLILSELTEQPASAMYQELGETSEWLPATFVLQAVKPADAVSSSLSGFTDFH